MSAHAHQAAQDVLAGVRADLESLIRIPSVSADPAAASDVRRSAGAIAELFQAEGGKVTILRVDGGHPAVLARFPAAVARW